MDGGTTNFSRECYWLVDQTCVEEHTRMQCHLINGLCWYSTSKAWGCGTYVTFCAARMETTSAPKSLQNVPKSVPVVWYCHWIQRMYSPTILGAATPSRISLWMAKKCVTFPTVVRVMETSTVHCTQPWTKSMAHITIGTMVCTILPQQLVLSPTHKFFMGS